MDDYSIELSRGLYAESLSHQRRSEEALQNQMRNLSDESTSRFLISRVNLKSISYLMLFTLVLASVSILVSSKRSVEFLATELKKHSTHSHKLIVASKDLQLIVREVISAELEEFSSELVKTKVSRSEFIESKYKEVEEITQMLQHHLRGSTAEPLLNSFYLGFADWKLQHDEWSQQFSFGDSVMSYSIFEEEVKEYRERLLSTSYNLSHTLVDLQRRDLLRIEAQTAFFSSRLNFSLFFLGVTVVLLLWSSRNFLGALSEFLRWFRQQSWDLQVEAERLSDLAKKGGDPKQAEELAKELHLQSAHMRKVLARLMEAFSGEINGERAAWNRKIKTEAPESARILNFELGVKRMRGLLSWKKSQHFTSDNAENKKASGAE